MEEKKIRLVVSDMDGTLLRNDKSISEANRTAIRAGRKKGIRFSICTGRIQTMTEYYLRNLELDTPVITVNGALIWDPVECRSLWKRPMVEEELIDFLRFCRETHLDYCALTMEACYFSPHNMRKQRFLQYNRTAQECGLSTILLKPFDETFDCIKGKEVFKVLVYEVERGQFELAENYVDTLQLTGCTTSDTGLLDVAHTDVNKGMGLVQLARILGIPLHEVCAVGDYDNDIPMLEASGFPVAMGNARSAVKEKAQFVTKTNMEDGIAFLYEQHFL